MNNWDAAVQRAAEAFGDTRPLPLLLPIASLIVVAYVIANLALNIGETCLYVYDPPAFGQFVELTKAATQEIARIVPAIGAVDAKMVERHYEYRLLFFTHILSLNFLVWGVFMFAASVAALVESVARRREVRERVDAMARFQKWNSPSSLLAVFVALNLMAVWTMYFGPAFAGMYPVHAGNFGIAVVSFLFWFAAIIWVFLFPLLCAWLVESVGEPGGAI